MHARPYCFCPAEKKMDNRDLVECHNFSLIYAVSYIYLSDKQRPIGSAAFVLGSRQTEAGDVLERDVLKPEAMNLLEWNVAPGIQPVASKLQLRKVPSASIQAPSCTYNSFIWIPKERSMSYISTKYRKSVILNSYFHQVV